MNEARAQASPHFSTGGLVLEALSTRDFAGLARLCDPDVTMIALLPRGVRECRGSDEVRAAFEGWFGDAVGYEVDEAWVGNIGPLLDLRWRLRVRWDRSDGDPAVVEQHVFASTGASGRVHEMRLLCSGFHKDETRG